MTLELVQLGTFYYIVCNGRKIRDLSYPEYKALSDYNAGKIPADEIPSSISFHEYNQESVHCCEKGMLPRGLHRLVKQGALTCENIIHGEVE